MSTPRKGAFRSLRRHNYRLWAAGALVSNIGTSVQRIAQDWLVLTVLTHRSAAAVGIVMALVRTATAVAAVDRLGSPDQLTSASC